MVILDIQLLSAAHRLLDETNLNKTNRHRLVELVLAYVKAVDLHNRQCPTHEIYRIQSEMRLRQYVLACHDEDRQKRTTEAIERANGAQSFFSN
jgi:hypothetical protein